MLELTAYFLHQNYHLILNILLLKHHLFLFPYSYMLHLSFKFSFREFSNKNFLKRIENLALKTALKACSLEQEPHIIVVTPFIPLGAHRNNVFFNCNAIKNLLSIPRYISLKWIISGSMKHSRKEKIYSWRLDRSDRR